MLTFLSSLGKYMFSLAFGHPYPSGKKKVSAPLQKMEGIGNYRDNNRLYMSLILISF